MVSPILKIEEIVSKTKDLPTIPAAALAVMRESESATCSAASIAKHIMQDQGLSARILRLANSAFYGLNRQVTTPQDAVVILGIRTVRNLAMVAASYPWMSKPIKGYVLGPKEMWAHGLGVAVGAQMIATRTKKACPDLTFISGLLHDLGKVALAIWLEARSQTMLKLAVQENLTFDEVERKILGFDHCDVGGYLAEQWNLPSSLGRAMRYHHNPLAMETPDHSVECIHIGDYMAMAVGLGIGVDGLRYELQYECLESLGLSESEFEEIFAGFPEKFHEYEEMFSLLND
ncbi:MAG: HDOD domain-containing protein [Fimbriimonadaceae bacterium]